MTPQHHLSRRSLLLLGAGTAASALLLSACGSDDGGAVAAVGGSLDDIVELAKTEGKVHLIAYPDDWANYGASFEAFTAKYGVEVEVSSPEISSAEELTAVQNLKGQSTQPDVLDIGYAFTAQAVSQGLLSPYVPSVIDEVPELLKDPEGYWVSAYYGVITFGVDANKVDVPTRWSDLLDPKYKGKITIGDPRTSAGASIAVFSAAMANGGGLDDIQPGIDFFGQLAASGNLVATGGNAQALETGEAAVTIDWNYNYSGIVDSLAASGVDLQTAIPEGAVVGTYYAQPATIDSPQPNAARLWIEWLLSDEGANIYAASGAIPARILAMREAGTLTPEADAALPSAEILETIVFPTIEQGTAAGQLLVDGWGQAVGL